MRPIVRSCHYSFVVDGWFCPLFLYVYLLPRVKDKRAEKRWGYWSVAAIGVVGTRFRMLTC
ncbi:hypothetical protein ACFOSW_23930 [Paenibacillus sp. GCM10012303]